MFLVEEGNITITKGDSGVVVLNFQNADGSDYIPENDEIIFSVKRRKEQYEEIVLEKYGTRIQLESHDTQIPAGEYFYDVVIKRSTGEVFTPMEGKFTIRKAVHNYE